MAYHPLKFAIFCVRVLNSGNNIGCHLLVSHPREPMTWIYFLKERSSVLGFLKSFKELVETQSSLSLKSLRIDNKREHSSAKFDDFCADFRMQHQYTVSYFPQ